jgi:RND family efflux transporter MFP subunit
MYAVVTCLAICSCRDTDTPEAEPALVFPVASPEIRDAVIEREYVAEIRAVRHAELRSRLKGILETVSADEGQEVRAGDRLFVVGARGLQQELLVARAAVAGAEAELKTAQLELENTKLLQEKNVVSKAELELGDAKVQLLRAKLAEAKATAERAAVELGLAEVRAPFDGVINRIPRKTGSVVTEGDLLTTLTDVDEVFAYFRITEHEHLEHRTSKAPRSVSLKLVDGTVFPGEGIVDAIESEFDRETATLAYRARFENRDRTLRHGSSGKVVIRSKLRQAVIVPQEATFDVQGDLYVYVVDATSVPRARKLIVQARLADSFVVAGLARDERFVLEGVQKIKDGTRIEITSHASARQAAVQGS